MAGRDFVHLHLHSAYSMLDGAIRLDDLARKATEYGMDTVAITDHGNMFGAIDFYTKMKKAGIKPIIGCEVYITPGDRRDMTRRSAFHLILLAENETGYRNLVRLVSKAYLEGFYYHPRIDYELLEQYHDGLIALSACLAGEIPSAILEGHPETAREIAARYASIFGPDHFFLEVQVNGMADQVRANDEILKISRELGIPLVATNDSHYLNKDDKKAHEVLLCIQTGKTMEDADRFSYESDQLYFRSAEEMIPLFEAFPDAVLNTRRIADRCNLTLTLDKPMLPKFQLPNDTTLEQYLEELARRGLEERLTQLPYKVDRDVYFNRLAEEIGIITNMGFSGYFLIVADFIHFAHEQNIPVGPGRGSGAGSIVAFALRITDMDPIPYDLLFERFLNPERVSMPDFDIDFCMNRREEVIQYVSEKYGRDRVGKIVTFNCLKAKAVIRDVGRVLRIPLPDVDRLAKLIPLDPKMTLDNAVIVEPKLKESIAENPKFKELFDIARRLEGLNRHAGEHAAGVVISEGPLWETVPVKKEGADDIMTQYAKEDVEKAGLVKFDFLGLRTLTVLDIAQKLTNQTRSSKKKPIDLRTIGVDDPAVYEYISTGNCFGVFQMEGSGFQEMIRKMRPSCFGDIIAAVALYRPGPMDIIPDFIARKHGEQKITYPHASLEASLKDTYGLIVYQEQVMQISRTMAGFSLGHADLLRRAMGKKKKEEMAKMREVFIRGDLARNIQGAIALGYEEQTAGEVFDLMEKFALYGFNKSHAAGYAMLSYQTAYMKRYHPREFMTAVMTCDMGHQDKVVKAISECRKMAIPVLPPDVNSSGLNFTVVEDGIRFGLAAIKNVGVSAVESIIRARNSDGPFLSLFDFYRRVDLRLVNRKVGESLIRCGAFDSFGYRRRQLMDVIDTAIEVGAQSQKDRDSGQISLFAALDPGSASEISDPKIPDTEEWDRKELLANEKDMLGFYVTGHPLMSVKAEIDRFCTHDSSRLEDAFDGDRVVMCGIVSHIKKLLQKTSKEQMAFVTIEDLEGSFELMVRPAMWEKYRDVLETESIVFISGFASVYETNIRVRTDEILSMADGRRRFTRAVVVSLATNGEAQGQIRDIERILQVHKGSAQVQLALGFPEGHSLERVTLDLGSNFRVDPGDSCIKDFQAIAGFSGIDYR